jgi:YcaO-like protein with predicted kinase domain
MTRSATSEKRYLVGTHRVCAPEDTLARWEPEASRFGITRIADVTDLDVIGIPVYQAIRPNARSLSVSQGKGVTHAAAKVSALMEAAELWHAEHHEVPMVRASARDLGARVGSADGGARVGSGDGGARATVADLDRLPQRGEARLAASTTLLWVEGEDLAGGGPVWVPEQLVGMDVTLRPEGGSAQLSGSTTGLASGNTFHEAVLSALLEVIERDAFRLGTHREAWLDPSRRIDPASIDEPTCRTLVDTIEAAGVVIALVDMTSDLGVPTVACFLTDRDRNPFRVLPLTLGSGCHPSPAVAASRALTEAAQSRLTVIAGSRDDLTAADYGHKRWSAEAGKARDELLAAATRASLDALPGYASDTVDGDVDATLERLRARGIDRAVVVDLTIARIGMPVVKVVVPGLEAMETFTRPGSRARAALS